MDDQYKTLKTRAILGKKLIICYVKNLKLKMLEKSVKTYHK